MSTQETEITMTRKRNTILASAAVLAAAGLGAGVAVAATGHHPGPRLASHGPACCAAIQCAHPSALTYCCGDIRYSGTMSGLLSIRSNTHRRPA